ncbi:hypothetical protein PanWU01x14_033060 [Parasponia andersonii]|uniref:Uncharacterized protein n=1 Tax=Parasponia andersonii TaxID=3476 RepID=A0A2P5DTK3_PARAD|nr:hypothetical protein PanWU01x14_033060 [Parasponia andersonii]
MGRQGKEEEKKKNKIIKETTEVHNKTKEVIITVYVEQPSPSLPPPQPIHPRKKGGHIPTKKSTKSKPFFPNNQQTTKTRGYDRRAQLLAYSQVLRKSDPRQPELPKTGSKPKHKMTIPVGFQRIRSRTRFQRSVPEVDISCRPKSVTGRKKNKKKKANKHTDSRFVVKLRGILRGFCRD